MEKQVYELKIDPEFRDLIPPLSEEEYRMLEDSIVRDGCDTPLTVWNGIIVDGHNRYEICQRHNVPFAYEEKAFDSREDVVFWMLERQLARRNLNSYQRSILTLKYEPILRKNAAARQATSTGGIEPQLRPNLAEADNKHSTRDQLAKLAGVSHGTLDKVKHLAANADEDTKKKLRDGDVSIHKAYTDLLNKEHDGETRICESCHEEKPYSEFTIPSNRRQPRNICKDCEAKAQRPTVVDPATDTQYPSGKNSIQIKNGKTAHIALGLPDDPAMFGQVMDLLKHAQNAYLAAFAATLAQYHPSMISEEHSDLIRQLIDYVADTTEDLLDKHLNNQKEEE